VLRLLGLPVVALTALVLAVSAPTAPEGGVTIALVTAETLNQLVAVDLPSGRILRRLTLPADPENVEAELGTAVVVSSRAGAVTIVDPNPLRIRKVLRGFGSPHIVALAPGGRYAYVTDDARGQLVVIALSLGRVVRKLSVGLGAHHIAVRPDGRRLWIALGERARTLVIVDTTRPDRPRVLGRVDPGGEAHDLVFSPNGKQVWVTYSDRASIAVFDAATGRVLYRIPAGSPPQHVLFGQPLASPTYGRYAFVTSGNDGSLRIFLWRQRRLLRSVRIPIGSFNASSTGNVIATSSLTQGVLTEITLGGRRLLTKRIAPVARDAAIAVLP
jgi:DNA-binding beta-propeller fold protein YncE